VSDPEVAERLAAVRERIAEASRRAGRQPGEVTLVGASKRVPRERVLAAVEAGLSHLGENYVQEAAEKVDWVAERASQAPRWHLIGRLQRNKARAALELFDTVESVDRASLARELARRARAAGRLLPVLIQVNLSEEPQKAGVAAAELPALLELCAGLEGLRVEGLMAIPAPEPDPERSRPAFARLRELRERLRPGPGGAHLRELSMGMSADFEVAVEEGATRVRVGTALFGPRPPA
jgi:pyridoxal phosphate enzyme (YggS family)